MKKGEEHTAKTKEDSCKIIMSGRAAALHWV